MVVLHTKCGTPFIVDRDVAEALTHARFYLRGKTTKRYVHAQVGAKCVSLARFVIGSTDRGYIDHVNGDQFDNRRENLRVCSNQQNLRNMRSKGGTSKYKGVSRCGAKFMARIMVDGKDVRRQSFTDEIAAAQAYDAWASELFGEFAWLNRDHFQEVARPGNQL